MKLELKHVVDANNVLWQQMPELVLRPTEISEGVHPGSALMSGSVVIEGVWTGCIEVWLEKEFAYVATSAMMMQPLPTVSEADVIDAVKEIANIVGGLLKSTLPRPTSMKVPEFTNVADALYKDCDAKVCLTVAFRHASGMMLVRVREVGGI